MKDSSYRPAIDADSSDFCVYPKFTVRRRRNDNRVRQLWRKIVTFTPDRRHVAELSRYETGLREAPRQTEGASIEN